MKQKYIESIERQFNGSLLIRFYDGRDSQKRVFYSYSKRDALKAIRHELGIKRNYQSIIDWSCKTVKI